MIKKIMKGIVPDYINEVAKLRAKFSFSKFVIIVLAAIIIFLVNNVVNQSKSQRTVFVPMGMSESFEIGDNYASANLLNAMGSYIATLLYNFNAKTVYEQYEQVAKLMTEPSRVDAFKQADEYVKANVSSRIIIKNIKFTDKVIRVYIDHTKYILDKPQSEKKLVLTINYKLEYGSFKILKLEVEND